HRLWQTLEQGAIMRLNALERLDERIAEGIGVGEPRKPSHAIKLLPVCGNYMGLLVTNHLQPVLDAAEKEIDLRQLAGGFARDPAAFSQALQRLDGSPR